MRKTLFFLAVLGWVSVAWAADPFVGTWKLDVAKSQSKSIPKQETLKVVSQGNGFKTSFEGVDSKGKAYQYGWSATYDGKEHPRVGNPDEDTIVMKKIDPNTITVVTKKAGKEVSSWRVSVSRDGKTQTAAGKVTDSKGQVSRETWVYDKQ